MSKSFITTAQTTNFRHLVQLQRRKKLPGIQELKSVPVKDRIKWWNIVPGDRVRLMTDKENRLHEVKGINKYWNRVYVDNEKSRKEYSEENQQPPTFKNIHYSGLQLYLGNFDFPSLPGSSEKRNLPVFALRLGTTEPRWEAGQWVWERFATATMPRLPSWRPGSQERITISWPERPKPVHPDPTAYDTTNSVVAEVTYSPTPLPAEFVSGNPEPSEQFVHDYVRMLRREMPYSQDQPAELLLARELSNPHSRAKKRERYLAARARQQSLLKTFIEAELTRKVEGRTRKDAIAEATFRWKERLRLDRKAELKRRWVARGLEARLERRRRRAQEKLEAEKKKLRDLIVRQAPHQVMPEL